MCPVGAYITIELITDEPAIPMTLPEVSNIEFLTGRINIARRSRSASADQAPSSKRTNGAHFSVVSPTLPRDRRDISAPNTTVSKRSGPALTGVALGGILVACFAVLLLLLVPCYLKRRRRRLQSTRVNDVENDLSRQASFGSGNHKTLSMSHSDYLPQSNLSPAPSISQPSPKTTVLDSLPALPSSKVTGERTRKATPPARPPPLLLSPVRANREARQGDSSEMGVPVGPPASCLTDGRIRKSSLPARPAPLLLPPGRAVRKARESGSITMAKARAISPTNGDNRGSFLPNPWDGDAKPQPVAFEWEIFQLPSFTAPVRPLNFSKAGLPRTPRETRTSMSPKVRSLEVTQDVVDRSGVKPRQRPVPI